MQREASGFKQKESGYLISLKGCEYYEASTNIAQIFQHILQILSDHCYPVMKSHFGSPGETLGFLMCLRHLSYVNFSENNVKYK